jgi:hypothetical protein
MKNILTLIINLAYNSASSTSHAIFVFIITNFSINTSLVCSHFT